MEKPDWTSGQPYKTEEYQIVTGVSKMHSESHYYRLCKTGTWLRWKSSPWCFSKKETRLTCWRPSFWLFVFAQIDLPKGRVQLFLPFNSCPVGVVKTWSKERRSLQTPITHQQLYAQARTHTHTHNGSEVLDLKLGSLVTGKRAWELVLWKAENHIYPG